MQRIFYPIATIILIALVFPVSGRCTNDVSDAVADILIRTGVKPEDNIVVGRRVMLHVDVLAPDGWAQIIRLRDFSVEGAQVVRYESQGTRLNETIQGRAFSGQRYELSLFPQRDGTVTVPSIPVEVEVSRWGSKSGKQFKRVQTPEVSFEVQVPPGAEGVAGLISTPGLKATQRWEPEQQKFMVGEAVKRTIALSGRDVSGMAFTPLLFESTEMVSAYPAEPRVDDRFDRGNLTGERVERVTYVFTKKGTIELPEIDIPWWDIDQKKLKRAVLPALQLEIIPSPTTAIGQTDGETARERICFLPYRLGIALILLTALLSMIAFHRRRIHSWWTKRQQARRDREDFLFRRFTQKARTNDPKAALNSLMSWLDRIHTGPGAARLDEFLQCYGDKSSLAEADRLGQALYKEHIGWTGRPLVEAVRTARHRWKKARQTGEGVKGLTPLNP